MGERPETPQTSGPARRGRGAARDALAPDVRALVERAALVENGRAVLHLAPLECAAVLLGERPRALERVRAALEERSARAEALAVFARAAASRAARPPGAPAEARPGPRGAEEIVRAAEARPDGLSLLLAAATECAAIAFGVRPEIVDAARALARSRGLSAPERS